MVYFIVSKINIVNKTIHMFYFFIESTLYRRFVITYMPSYIYDMAFTAIIETGLDLLLHNAAHLYLAPIPGRKTFCQTIREKPMM